MRRVAFTVALVFAGCSFITDFDPSKANSGGTSGATGTGGIGGSGGTTGTGGSGGMIVPDAAVPDAPPLPPDASIDARVQCSNDSQCDDGIACTTDSCSFGTCQHQASNTFCGLPTMCTRDMCSPTAPNAGPDGCVHEPVQCSGDEVCDAQQGCVQVQCSTADQCPPSGDCCQIPQCTNNGRCTDAPKCPNNQRCIQVSTNLCSCL